MKKIGLILIGIVIGAGITLSPQIYGAGAKLLGAKVDKTMEIKLNGKSIGQGAVIDGTSYIPVRSAANALGMGVSVDSTQVNLTTLNSAEQNAAIAREEQAKMDQEQQGKDNAAFIEKLNRDIASSKRKIESYNNAMNRISNEITRTKNMLDTVNANAQAPEESIKEAQEKYNTAVNAESEMQKKIDAEQKNLADLESQLASLQQK
jgi:predicted RNase H-like nuclease (RuvC/YqgF family)